MLGPAVILYSGRSMAFCPSGPGLNPRGTVHSNLDYYAPDVVNLLVQDVKPISIRLRERDQDPTSFLFRVINMVNYLE